jgi:hypothetical protein
LYKNKIGSILVVNPVAKELKAIIVKTEIEKSRK